jgi:hypothetical protein
MNAVLLALFPHRGGFGVKKLLLRPVRAGKESAVSTPSAWIFLNAGTGHGKIEVI